MSTIACCLLSRPDPTAFRPIDHEGLSEPLLQLARSGNSGLPDDPDQIPGSSDDLHVPQLPPTSRPDNLHFFRVSDNNPFAIDATTIDFNTYKRATTPTSLPAGHRWAANGNEFVAAQLGLGLATMQDSMISIPLDEARYRGLIATT